MEKQGNVHVLSKKKDSASGYALLGDLLGCDLIGLDK
jgi:hypothetical protein